MNYRYQKPNTLIAGYVRTVLILEASSQPATHKLPLFTNGMPALFCRTEKDEEGNEQVAQLALFGQSTSPGCWEINNNTTIVCYFFKPFAMAAIFNIAANKLTGGPVDLCNWNAHKINALRTQVVYAGSTNAKVAILDNLLIHQLQLHTKECEIIRYATDEMMNDPGTEILSGILKKLKLTERTFQRMFKKYVGITPNQYRRICQFQLSFTQLRSKSFDKLTDIAYDNGFADQSHFIRSFKEFTETTPNNYLKEGLKKKN